MDEMIVVVKLINGEILVGTDIVSDHAGEKITVKGPVRYETRNNQVFLTPYFGSPKIIRFAIDRVLYDYPIDDANLIEKYKGMANKPLIKPVNSKIILAS